MGYNGVNTPGGLCIGVNTPIGGLIHLLAGYICVNTLTGEHEASFPAYRVYTYVVIFQQNYYLIL